MFSLISTRAAKVFLQVTTETGKVVLKRGIGQQGLTEGVARTSYIFAIHSPAQLTNCFVRLNFWFCATEFIEVVKKKKSFYWFLLVFTLQAPKYAMKQHFVLQVLC